MKFSEAIELCMQGKRITRADWNGKGMYVYYTKGKTIDVSAWTGSDDLSDSECLRGYIVIKGHFDMYNAQGERVIGWLASQTDMASDEWMVVE